MPYARQRHPQKTAAQLKAEGAHIKHGSKSLEDNPTTVGSPVMPEGLDDEEQALWEEVVGTLPDGLLTHADTWLLEKFVVQCCFARRCSREIADGGMVISGPNGMLQRNPLISARQSALQSMQAAAESLGLTPTARTRLAAPTQREDEPPPDLFGTLAPMTTPGAK
jgi:P27 family predicted phage terminase small subunit